MSSGGSVRMKDIAMVRDNISVRLTIALWTPGRILADLCQSIPILGTLKVVIIVGSFIAVFQVDIILSLPGEVSARV
jgi:hypothetical protein